MLFKVISLSIKTDLALFFNSSRGRTALDAQGNHFEQHLIYCKLGINNHLEY